MEEKSSIPLSLSLLAPSLSLSCTHAYVGEDRIKLCHDPLSFPAPISLTLVCAHWQKLYHDSTLFPPPPPPHLLLTILAASLLFSCLSPFSLFLVSMCEQNSSACSHASASASTSIQKKNSSSLGALFISIFILRHHNLPLLFLPHYSFSLISPFISLSHDEKLMSCESSLITQGEAHLHHSFFPAPPPCLASLAHEEKFSPIQLLSIHFSLPHISRSCMLALGRGEFLASELFVITEREREERGERMILF